MTEVVVTHVDSYVYRQDESDLKYLLLKRHKAKIYGHLWQGVAGQIEGGETAVQTVMRELIEETGLEPAKLFIVDHVSSFYQSYKDRMHLVPVFGVEVHSEKVVLSAEHAEYRWVSLESALELLTWSKQKEAISALNDMLLSGDERLKWSEVDLT